MTFGSIGSDMGTFIESIGHYVYILVCKAVNIELTN